MAVLLLRQIERELIVDGQIIVAGAFARIAVIVIGAVALLAVVAGQAFGAAIAFRRLRMAVGRLTVAFALAAWAAIDRITPEAGTACVTIGSGR